MSPKYHGDLHHALHLWQQLLDSEQLTAAQQKQLSDYLATLGERMVQWIREWRPCHSQPTTDMTGVICNAGDGRDGG